MLVSINCMKIHYKSLIIVNASNSLHFYVKYVHITIIFTGTRNINIIATK